jgi:hypothetical protein
MSEWCGVDDRLQFHHVVHIFMHVSLRDDVSDRSFTLGESVLDCDFFFLSMVLELELWTCRHERRWSAASQRCWGCDCAGSQSILLQ